MIHTETAQTVRTLRPYGYSSVCHICTLQYPAPPLTQRSPGVPALPGPCYWLVASRTPMGWRGGCLAAGLVPGAVYHYYLGGCSAVLVCATIALGQTVCPLLLDIHVLR